MPAVMGPCMWEDASAGESTFEFEYVTADGGTEPDGVVALASWRNEVIASGVGARGPPFRDAGGCCCSAEAPCFPRG